MEEGYKDCPYCAETIKAGAIKFKHCKSLLANISSSEKAVTEQQEVTNGINKPNSKINKQYNSYNDQIESSFCHECGSAIEGIDNYCPQCIIYLTWTSQFHKSWFSK